MHTVKSSKLSELVSAYNAAVEGLRSATASDLLEAFAAKFEENPRVRGLVWKQYTPYYNDGDPCHFRISYEQLCRSALTDRARDWTWVAGTAPALEEVEASFANTSGGPDDDDEADHLDPVNYKDPGFKITTQVWRRDRYVDCPHDVEDIRQTSDMVAYLESLPEDLIERVLGESSIVYVWKGGIATSEFYPN